MAVPAREHYIPVRCSALIDLLCGDQDLGEDERDLFRQFCRLVTAVYHYEYDTRLEELKASYAPFDPDADTKELTKLSADDQQRRLNELFSDFAWLMDGSCGCTRCRRKMPRGSWTCANGCRRARYGAAF